MDKIIAICDTYAQLINVIQIRRELFSSQYFSVVITNNSRNGQEISERLREENFFNEVVFWETKGEIEYIKQNYIQKILSIIPIISGKISGRHTSFKEKLYDLFLFYSIGPSSLTLFSYLYNYNKNIRCSRFEEGVLSYGFLHNEEFLTKYPTLTVKAIGLARSIFLMRNISDVLDDFYCYFPKVYQGRLKPVSIPKISMNSDIKCLLERIFAVDKANLEYRQKYIYFAAMYDDEGVQELELIQKVASLVGNENLLIKTHPRDNSGRFEKAGLIIDNNSSIPWEIIQLNYDFSDHVFLTITSQSVLSISLIAETHPPIYFMFKLLDMSKSKNAATGIRALHHLFDSMNSEVNGFYLANTFDEICE